MITGFASCPGRWFGLLSLPVIGAALVLFAVANFQFLGQATAEWIVSSTVGLLLLFLGAHLLSLGFIGELIITTGNYSPSKTIRNTIRILGTKYGNNDADR